MLEIVPFVSWRATHASRRSSQTGNKLPLEISESLLPPPLRGIEKSRGTILSLGSLYIYLSISLRWGKGDALPAVKGWMRISGGGRERYKLMTPTERRF